MSKPSATNWLLNHVRASLAGIGAGAGCFVVMFSLILGLRGVLVGLALGVPISTAILALFALSNIMLPPERPRIWVGSLAGALICIVVATALFAVALLFIGLLGSAGGGGPNKGSVLFQLLGLALIPGAAAGVPGALFGTVVAVVYSDFLPKKKKVALRRGIDPVALKPKSHGGRGNDVDPRGRGFR